MNNLVGNALLSSFDIDEITSEALLLQTGYLTFGKTFIQEDEKYDRLCYPNREVRQNLRALLSRMGGAVVSRLFRLRTRERGWAGMGGHGRATHASPLLSSVGARHASPARASPYQLG